MRSAAAVIKQKFTPPPSCDLKGRPFVNKPSLRKKLAE